MKKTRRTFTSVIALLLTLAMLFALAACNPNTDPTNEPSDPPASSSGTGGDPTDPKPTESNPTTPNPTDPNPTDPANPSDLKITVMPDEMEIYAGEEIDLLFGVSVNNAEASLIIFDDNDFDQDTPGEYVITYKANLNGASVTATRTIVVLEPLSALALEVRTNYLGATKWDGNLINFAHALFVELSADAICPLRAVCSTTPPIRISLFLSAVATAAQPFWIRTVWFWRAVTVPTASWSTPPIPCVHPPLPPR